MTMNRLAKLIWLVATTALSGSSWAQSDAILIDNSPTNNGRSQVVADGVRFLPTEPSVGGPGIFLADFDDGQPEGTHLYGSALVRKNVLQLTTATRDQLGTFVLGPLHGTKPIASFVADFKAYIGGGNGADGFGFALSAKFPKEAFSESAMQTGLVVVFDTYRNAGEEMIPGARVLFNGVTLAAVPIRNLRADRFVEVSIKLDPDGSLDLARDGELLLTGVRLGVTSIGGQFAFFGRTGAQTDEHSIDDVRIETKAAAGPFVESFKPVGTNASPDTRLELLIRDFVTQLDPRSIKMEVDGASVSPALEKRSGGTVLSYEFPRLLEPGSEHSVSVRFANEGGPRETNSFSYSFAVTRQVRLSK